MAEARPSATKRPRERRAAPPALPARQVRAGAATTYDDTVSIILSFSSY